MAHIGRPYILIANEVIPAEDLNINFSKLYTEFNGNIDDSNIKQAADIDGAKIKDASITAAKIANNTVIEGLMDYSSLMVVRTGPNFSAGPNGTRIARGRKATTYSAGVVSVNIVFSADSDDGDPQFMNAPRVTCTVEHTASYTVLHTASPAPATRAMMSRDHWWRNNSPARS